ncbi:MAG TPA: pentapeptide repeat-containing protein [Nitrospira sp.]|nr:pentapeptide repeat-containing protein [Nitrospira sp.]
MLLGANLSRTNLANANLEGAMLLGANMEGARIDGADFKGAAFLTQEQVDEACGNPKILPEGLRMPQPC